MKFFERAKSRRELVVAFLSVLELVRMSEITLVQNETFGAIMAQKWRMTAESATAGQRPVIRAS